MSFLSDVCYSCLFFYNVCFFFNVWEIDIFWWIRGIVRVVGINFFMIKWL